MVDNRGWAVRFPYCAPDTASSRIGVGLTQSKDGAHPDGGKHAPARRVAWAGHPSTPPFVLRRLPGLGRDQRLNQREQFRNPYLRRRPHDVQVDRVVSVRDAVAHSDHSGPRYRRMPFPELHRDPSRCLARNLEPSYDGVLQLDASHEVFPRHAFNVGPHQPGRRGDVQNVRSDTIHRWSRPNREWRSDAGNSDCFRCLAG